MAQPSLDDVPLDPRKQFRKVDADADADADRGDRIRRLDDGLQAETGSTSENVPRRASDYSACRLSDLQVSDVRKSFLQNQQADLTHENTQVG